MTKDKQINKFSDLTFTQFLGYDLVATFNNNNKIKELQEQLKHKEQECEELKDKLNCCFCNPNVELNNIEKQRKCVEVTECFRRQLDQLKAENEILEKVNKANQEKIKKLNEKLEEEFIAKQYGDEALFFTLINIKEICNNNDELQGDFNLVDCDKYKLGKHNLAKKILEEIKVVIDE